MKALIFTLASLLFVLSLALPAAGTTTVTDDMGTSVTIPAPPNRIISLSPSTTEILFALGLNDKIVGVTEFCNYPPAALDKPKIGGFSTVSIEKVIVQKPELVVAAYGNGNELMDQLRSLNMTLICMNPQTISDVLHDITLIGEATGTRENASLLTGRLEARIQSVEDTSALAHDRPKVAHVIWNDPIYVSGNGTFQDEMIRMAGGVNAFHRVEGWKNIGIEDFITADPDVLIVNAGSGMGGEENVIADYFLKEPRFANVKAIRNQRVYIVNIDTVNRAGPRIVDALEAFSRDIHPELYADATQTIPDTPPAPAPGFGAFAIVCAFAGATLLVLHGIDKKRSGNDEMAPGCGSPEKKT